MDHRGDQRPPRAAQPSYPQQRPAIHPDQQRNNNVSFQNTERGDRNSSLDANRQRSFPSAYHRNYDRVGRKKSLVRPDREKIDPGIDTTGNYPQRDGLRRGRSLLAREEDQHESGLALFKRGHTLRRKRQQASTGGATVNSLPDTPKKNRGCYNGPGPGGPWMIYCLVLTFWMPNVVLKTFGIRTPEAQRAWREKMGLLGIILTLMAGVGFLTFGFTEAVCGTPPNRFHGGAIGDSFVGNSSVVIHGYDYDFSSFKHPRAGSTFDGTTNPKVNQNCLGMMSRSSSSSISGSGDLLDWYFPCNVYSQYGNSGVNITGYESNTNCHVSSTAKNLFDQMQPQGQVYYTWDDVKNGNRNLAVFESTVLDLNLLNWLSRAQVNYPDIFDDMKSGNGTYNGKDLTMVLIRTNQRQLGHCLQDIATIGFIDTKSIGCVASEVVLYLSLVFIIGVVAIRFVMAVMFQWFFSWKLGNFPRETYEQRMQRSAEIENWTNDIYRPAPSEYRPNVGKGGIRYGGKNNRKTFLPSTSRFTPAEMLKGGRPTTAYGMLDSSSSGNWKRSTMYSASPKGGKGTPPDTPSYQGGFQDSQCPFPLQNVVPQPGPDYEPFNFPLAHTICLVTAYSESVEGLRTTLDSLATTDYPNSHKLILIIADGMVKGDGNNMTTPEICLTMMKDFVIAPNDVEPHSYVAIADGHKRHNMAKVYAGFYDYDNATIEGSKQQRVPIVLVAKCGNPLEKNDAKPGNRGKRDSQIVLMAFLQKVMFDERMTTFEYEFFNSIWRATGVSPDRYELVLCVDADTKVFPDSLTRMVSCMVHDEEIMGLCGETKIANKAETFVTMMQVFEYYISHHMTKAFESMFGGVTCLPGCFSMYRIKAPKGDSGYWVPILANPDIVEHYSENIVDTLHKKNLLLLGEDRYLTTLMLKTFPKRKNMFCPQAVCKTVVPDTFRVLLSQRRRWINSTIHNLAELLLVRDLCGTFCFSMQFVVGMELAGTLVLPAAIAFTLYLIISSIIPGGPNTTIPLILLAIVLGLPGLLIVVTSRKIAYVGWMLVYLLSLPIWNGILPAYSFWHFDDFSWGQTRKVAGDTGADHGDKDGEFDSSHMRWKSGTQSRDSTYYEKKTDSNRYSLASNSDATHTPPQCPPRNRHDSNAVLMLPAPLAVNRQMMASNTTVARSSEDNYNSDAASGSYQRLISSPQSADPYAESYDSSPSGRLLSPTSQDPRYGSRQVSPQPQSAADPFRSMTTSPTSYEGEPQLQHHSSQESDELVGNSSKPGRGVRLMDGGPVPGPEGVRRVSRQAVRRPTSQAPPQNRYSRSSTAFSLPPGAAPPQSNPYGGAGY
ncbi:glycosyltransferase family 2 protein [Cyathus striatus]|nr:glycosyltransferase family 2 protein [Cyathus striatus]